MSEISKFVEEQKDGLKDFSATKIETLMVYKYELGNSISVGDTVVVQISNQDIKCIVIEESELEFRLKVISRAKLKTIKETTFGNLKISGSYKV